MIVTQPPKRFLDEDDGSPIESIEPEGSRFEQIDVKRTDDGVEVRAKEAGTGEVTEIQAPLTEQMFRGVSADGDRPREIDDDIRDALSLVGYALVDDQIKGY